MILNLLLQTLYTVNCILFVDVKTKLGLKLSFIYLTGSFSSYQTINITVIKTLFLKEIYKTSHSNLYSMLVKNYIIF